MPIKRITFSNESRRHATLAYLIDEPHKYLNDLLELICYTKNNCVKSFHIIHFD